MLGSVRRFALAAVGGDRPGIVAAIARVLLEQQLNIEDSQMAILRGRFCVLLILAGADDVAELPLRSELERVGAELSLDAVVLTALSEERARRGAAAAGADARGPQRRGEPLLDSLPDPSPSCIITVYGADHPGIVHAVAAKLASAGVNITDLQTQLAPGEEEAAEGSGGAEPLERTPQSALYAMVIECELPTGMGVEGVEALLGEVRSEQSVDISVRELERDVL